MVFFWSWDKIPCKKVKVHFSMYFSASISRVQISLLKNQSNQRYIGLYFCFLLQVTHVQCNKFNLLHRYKKIKFIALIYGAIKNRGIDQIGSKKCNQGHKNLMSRLLNNLVCMYGLFFICVISIFRDNNNAKSYLYVIY